MPSMRRNRLLASRLTRKAKIARTTEIRSSNTINPNTELASCRQELTLKDRIRTDLIPTWRRPSQCQTRTPYSTIQSTSGMVHRKCSLAARWASSCPETIAAHFHRQIQELHRIVLSVLNMAFSLPTHQPFSDQTTSHQEWKWSRLWTGAAENREEIIQTLSTKTRCNHHSSMIRQGNEYILQFICLDLKFEI